MILNNWTNEHTSKFQNATFKAQHNLNKTGLFTDEALADLLDKHPRNKLDVCARDDHPIYEFKFRTGDVRDVDGQTLIKAAKEGSIWINVREAMNLHPDYKKVMNQMYAEIAQMTSRNIGHKAKCGLLITSPTAKTPYHFDAAEVILWHVRGHKRLFVYPLNEEFLADEAFEAALYRQTEDYLPYDKHMEKAARVIDLYDDELATWPLNSPHRVENMSFCVSVTTEYITRKSSYKNSIMYANAVLRSKFGLSPSWYRSSLPERLAKASFGKVLRNMGTLSSLKAQDWVSFTVDKNAPNFIRDIEPFQRNF